MFDLARRSGTLTPTHPTSSPGDGSPPLDVGPELAWMQALGVEVRSLPEVGAAPPAGPSGPDLNRPVLYLLDEDVPAPRCTELEDWVRRPLDPAELRARAERLLAMARRREQVRTRSASAQLRLHDDDIVRMGDLAVVLSRQEAMLLRALLDSLGLVVTRDALVDAAWGDRPPHDPRALDNRIRALRLRLDGLPLDIHTIRGRGFMAEAL